MILKIAFLLLVISVSTLRSQAQAKADKIYFIDTHNNVLSKQIIAWQDLTKEQEETNFDLPKAEKGNLAAQVFSIWCNESFGNGKAYARANDEIDSLYALVKRNPKKMMLVTNSKGLRKAMKKNRLAALIGVEGGHMIEDRIDYIDSLFKPGHALPYTHMEQ